MLRCLMSGAANGGSEMNKNDFWFIQAMQMVILNMLGVYEEEELCMYKIKCTPGNGDEYMLA